MRHWRIGPQLDRAPVACGCRLELFLLIERIAEMQVSVDVIRLGGDRPTQAIRGLFHPVRPLQHRPEIVMRHGKAGIELGGFAQARDRLVQTSEAGKRYSEIVVRLFGVGVEPDGLMQQLERFLVIAMLNRDDPEQVMGAGMRGMVGDRFLCRCLGGIEPPGAMMGQSRLEDELRIDGDDRRARRFGRQRRAGPPLGQYLIDALRKRLPHSDQHAVPIARPCLAE